MDPYVGVLQAALSGPTYITVDNTDYEGMRLAKEQERLANERARRAEAELARAQEESAAQATKMWWMPRMDAAEGQAVVSDLNYRAWRSVSEAINDGLMAAAGYSIEQLPESIVLRHYQSLIAQGRVTFSGRDTLKDLALVERWRLLGLAMDEDSSFGPLPDDVPEGALNYYKSSELLQNGTGGRILQDLVFMTEKRRRPGFIMTATHAGVQALRRLDQKGLAPPGIFAAIDAVIAKRDALYKYWIDEERGIADGYQNKIDQLLIKKESLEAQVEELRNMVMQQHRNAPKWFGKDAWQKALNHTTSSIYEHLEEIKRVEKEAQRLVPEKDSALSRKRWVEERVEVGLSRTMAMADLEDELKKDPEFVQRFAHEQAKQALTA